MRFGGGGLMRKRRATPPAGRLPNGLLLACGPLVGGVIEVVQDGRRVQRIDGGYTLTQLREAV